VVVAIEAPDGAGVGGQEGPDSVCSVMLSIYAILGSQSPGLRRLRRTCRLAALAPQIEEYLRVLLWGEKELRDTRAKHEGPRSGYIFDWSCLRRKRRSPACAAQAPHSLGREPRDA